jgi:hypothetical protein
MMKLCHTVFRHLITLSLFVIFVSGQNNSAPYGIGFYHANSSLPDTTCMKEFKKVIDFIYPTYYYEVANETNITGDVLDKIEDNYFRIYKKYLRGQQKEEQNDASNDDEEDRRLAIERQLQGWCYPLCDERPKGWLM